MTGDEEGRGATIEEAPTHAHRRRMAGSPAASTPPPNNKAQRTRTAGQGSTPHRASRRCGVRCSARLGRTRSPDVAGTIVARPPMPGKARAARPANLPPGSDGEAVGRAHRRAAAEGTTPDLACRGTTGDEDIRGTTGDDTDGHDHPGCNPGGLTPKLSGPAPPRITLNRSRKRRGGAGSAAARG